MTPTAWDTAFAVRIEDVNRVLATSGVGPSKFDVALPDQNLSASGTFNAWQITRGGGGNLIHLKLPLTATVQAGTPPVATTVTGTATIEVRLDFVPSAAGSGNRQLRVQTQPPPGVQAVTLVGIDPKPVFSMRIDLKLLLEEWLNTHLDVFAYVFAAIDLNRTAAKGPFQWLQPTSVGYAYTDLGSDSGVLAILCMTEGRSGAGLSPAVPTGAAPAPQQATFCISRERLVGSILLPAMRRVFRGSSLSDFKLSDSGDSIGLAGSAVSFQVTPKGSKTTYDVNVDSLLVEIDGDCLHMVVETSTDVAPGVVAHCRTEDWLNLMIGKTPQGAQTLTYSPAKAAHVEHWTDRATWVTVTEIALGIAALVAAIAAWVTGGATLIITALILGILSGLAIVLDVSISWANENSAPAIDDLVLDCTAPIVWTDSGKFALKSAGLNDALLLTGDPAFAT